VEFDRLVVGNRLFRKTDISSAAIVRSFSDWQTQGQIRKGPLIENSIAARRGRCIAILDNLLTGYIVTATNYTVPLLGTICHWPRLSFFAPRPSKNPNDMGGRESTSSPRGVMYRLT